VGFDLEGKLVWSLSNSGLGTTISGAGNSGPWLPPGNPPPYSYGRSAIDLQRTSDVLITAFCAGAGTSLNVVLNGFDDQGNLFGPLLTLTALTASGSAGMKFISGGRHGAGGTNSYVVFPLFGQIAWTVTGTFTGVEICVFSQ
jgi:hypothetical protein